MAPRAAVGAAGILLFASVGLAALSAERHHARLIAGVVVDNVVQSGAHHPVIRLHGEDVPTVAVVAMSPHEVGDDPLYRKGDQVAVLYDPARPDRGRIRTTFGRWGLPVLGLILACAALIVGLRNPRRAPASAAA